jgi:hypothetical protein
MPPVRRFLALPRARRLLLLRTAALLLTVRLALWILPFRTVRRLLLRHGAGRPKAPPASVADIVWSVRVARRVVPRATCLPQALTAKTLLARSGHAADLRIGVARDRSGDLEAHAWVETGGTVIVGYLYDLARFAPLPALPGELVE